MKKPCRCVCGAGKVPAFLEDEAYLSHLAPALAEAISRCRPDLAIYVSGADPYSGDRLGRLSLSREGLAERDRVVFAALCGAGVPVATRDPLTNVPFITPISSIR